MEKREMEMEHLESGEIEMRVRASLTLEEAVAAMGQLRIAIRRAEESRADRAEDRADRAEEDMERLLREVGEAAAREAVAMTAEELSTDEIAARSAQVAIRRRQDADLAAAEPVVVTRHPGLIDWLDHRGLIPADVRVITHATADDVRGRHVIGVIPIGLAALAASVTEVPLSVPAEMRGAELSEEQVEAYRIGPPMRYVVLTAGRGDEEASEAATGEE